MHLVFQTPFLPRLAAAFKRYAAKHGTTPAMAASVQRIMSGLRDPVTSGYQEQKVIAALTTAAGPGGA